MFGFLFSMLTTRRELALGVLAVVTIVAVAVVLVGHGRQLEKAKTNEHNAEAAEDALEGVVTLDDCRARGGLFDFWAGKCVWP